EIGDLTQVFTGLLLERLVEENVVQMDQPVLSLLPDTVSVPLYQGQPIELEHLATWSSGLPRLAPLASMPVLSALPPFARAAPLTSKKWLYDLLSSIDISSPPGTHMDGGPDVALGWFVETTPSGHLVWQHGASGTSRGFMAFLDGGKVGVVVLANAPVDVDLLGKRILNRLLAGSGA